MTGVGGTDGTEGDGCNVVDGIVVFGGALGVAVLLAGGATGVAVGGAGGAFDVGDGGS